MTDRLITALAVGLSLRVLPLKDRVTGLEHEGESVPVSEQKGGYNGYMGGCQNYGPFLDPCYNTAPDI